MQGDLPEEIVFIINSIIVIVIIIIIIIIIIIMTFIEVVQLKEHLPQEIGIYLGYFIIMSSIKQASVLCLREIIIILDIFVTIVIII